MPSIVASTLFDRPVNLCLLLIGAIITIFYFNPTTYLHTTAQNAPAASSQSHDWLVATISPALAQRRRNMIRTTWQSLYTGPPADFRFILANPGEEWMSVLQHENNTYGDLIMLSHLTESKELGMKTKELDFLVWLVAQGHEYKYVSKLDDDSYVDATTFHEEYLQPRLNPSISPNQQDPLIIGRLLGKGGTISLQFPFPYPGGQFWTMSWPVVKSVAHQYTISERRHDFADVLIGMMLYEAEFEFAFVDMPHSEAFELEEGQMNDEEWEHDITPNSINPHLLKADDVFLKVADEMRQVRSRKQWWKDEKKWDWDDREDARRGRTLGKRWTV